MNTNDVSRSEREAALAALDTTYATFLEAFHQVPDAALSYVPEGEEYTLGILPEHLCDPLTDYSAQLDAMTRTAFAPLDLSADAATATAKARRHTQLARWRPTADERADMFERLAAAHQRARAQLAAVSDADFTRVAPVIYSAAAAPYPTSACDIVGWLSAHYDEHTEQTRSLLARWQASETTQPRGL